MLGRMKRFVDEKLVRVFNICKSRVLLTYGW